MRPGTFSRRNTRSLKPVSDKMALLLEELEEARKAAKARDRNQCQAKVRGLVPRYTCAGYIHVHHITPRSRSRALYTALDNLVCLCEEHHVGATGVHENIPWAIEHGLIDHQPGDVIDD